MHKWKRKNYKMVGDKKYTLNKNGVYVDKDGYGSKALGYQVPQKVRKNAQGEYELAPKKHKKKNPTSSQASRAMDNETKGLLEKRGL